MMEENAKKEYLPISCDFYDELVLHIQRKHEVKVVYVEEDQRRTSFARLLNIETRKDSGEFLQLENGPWVRLDTIVAVSPV